MFIGAALAWAGLGGRIGDGAAATVAAQPLPQPVGEAKLAAPARYDAFAARPPFAQYRRPHPISLPGNGDEGARGDAGAFDYALTSVIITPRLRLAIVEPASGGESVRVREGESAEGLGGWRLLELRPRAAVFEGPGGRRELALRVWAGGGDGAAPLIAPPPASADAPPPPDENANRPLSAQGDPSVPDAAPDNPGPASAPTDTRLQMDAIRRRIEARRAQLRREAAQPHAAQPTNTPPPGTPARNP
jgi:general secretion pathway protein N